MARFVTNTNKTLILVTPPVDDRIIRQQEYYVLSRNNNGDGKTWQQPQDAAAVTVWSYPLLCVPSNT